MSEPHNAPVNTREPTLFTLEPDVMDDLCNQVRIGNAPIVICLALANRMKRAGIDFGASEVDLTGYAERDIMAFQDWFAERIPLLFGADPDPELVDVVGKRHVMRAGSIDPARDAVLVAARRLMPWMVSTVRSITLAYLSEELATSPVPVS